MQQYFSFHSKNFWTENFFSYPHFCIVAAQFSYPSRLATSYETRVHRGVLWNVRPTWFSMPILAHLKVRFDRPVCKHGIIQNSMGFVLPPRWRKLYPNPSINDTYGTQDATPTLQIFWLYSVQILAVVRFPLKVGCVCYRPKQQLISNCTPQCQRESWVQLLAVIITAKLQWHT